ncbi:Photosystem I assembly protein Ycf3 [Bienertia sinuspersici]
MSMDKKINKDLIDSEEAPVDPLRLRSGGVGSDPKDRNRDSYLAETTKDRRKYLCLLYSSAGGRKDKKAWFDQATEYWKQAIKLTPGNYIEAHNWLKITGRFE